MGRLDLLKLRKAAGISQRDLAEKLSVQPSFLSAIENGKSRFPDEKLHKLKEIIGLDDLSDYFVEDAAEAAVPPHTHAPEETDAIAQLLKHIHAQAHKDEHESKAREFELEERLDFMLKRNDRMSERIDELREEVDNLRAENFRLKEILTKNGLKY